MAVDSRADSIRPLTVDTGSVSRRSPPELARLHRHAGIQKPALTYGLVGTTGLEPGTSTVSLIAPSAPKRYSFQSSLGYGNDRADGRSANRGSLQPARGSDENGYPFAISDHTHDCH